VGTLLIIAALVLIAIWLGLRLRSALMRGEALDLVIQNLRDRERTTSQYLEAQRSAIFDNMVEGVALLDTEGRVQLANRPFQQFFGLAGDLRGKSLVECTRNHELAGLVARVTAEEPAQGSELRLSGVEDRWLAVNAAAVLNEAREMKAVVVVIHDLTRLKKLESNRQEFVANVSHELRTPLSLIKGYVETLLDGAKDDPEVATRFLGTIDRNAERLKLLIEDLLTISELESGQVQLHLQDFPVKLVMERLCEDYKPRADSRGVQLGVSGPDLTVRADAGRVQQVLSNLVDNAIKYGREKGTVTLSARLAEDGMVEACVADDGPGIPEAVQARVFERFYRADKARSREQGGTGLGLSIVKHIVQSHGGRVWVQSEVGVGSRFFFTLPAG
jgi:two-component system phosphate regulon sensor histidine kinase PhoR